MLCKEKTRYFRRSHISDAKFRAIIRYFAHDLPASKIAELSSVSRAAINQLFMKLRIRIAQVWNASSALSGEVEVVDMGYKKHFRVHHGEHEFARRNCHINGIESFWSYVKRKLAKFNGVPR